MIRKSFIISIIFLILVMFSTTALQYDVVNVTGKVGQHVQGQISVYYDNTTDHRFDINNVTITEIEGFEFIQINKLRYNETKYINYTYYTDIPTESTEIGKIWYFYYTNTSKEQEEISVLISESAIENTNFTIYLNDTVIWHNIGDTNLTITNLDDLSDTNTVPVDGSYSRNFIETGQFNYFDEITNHVGYITILSNIQEQETHTPNYDRNINFNVSINYRKANFTVEILPTTFSMGHNEAKAGLIQIISNDTLHNVELNGDWFGFSENDFTMDNDKIFSFNITPKDITNSDQTNKTYEKTITITSENGGTIEKTISIFINYATLDDLQDQLGDVVLIPMTAEQTYAYCNKPEINWTGICEKWIKNVTTEKLVPRILYPEINETDAKDSLDAGNRAEEGINRVSNKVEDLAGNQRDLASFIEDMQTTLTNWDTKYSNKIDAIELDVNKKRRDSGTFMFLILMVIFFAIIGGIVWLILYLKKRAKPTLNLSAG